MKARFAFAAAGLCVLAPLSYAAPPVQAKVTFAGVYANGNVYVALDTVVQEPGCAVPRFDVVASSPAAKSVLATALVALAAGKSIQVATYGCFNGYPTLDPTKDSYFFVLP